jgi:hypothetical protein
MQPGAKKVSFAQNIGRLLDERNEKLLAEALEQWCRRQQPTPRYRKLLGRLYWKEK